MNTIKVSVCVVSYNQKNYIEKCLQSILNQETSFNFDIIISDDCSTDGTGEIVGKYSEMFPDKIKAFIQNKNVGPVENYFCAHRAASGEYIAHVDGDDYLLPEKLSKQIKFMEENNCNQSFHRCQSLFSDGSFSSVKSIGNHVFNGFSKLFYQFPFYSWHSAKMYRRSIGVNLNIRNELIIDKHLHFFHGAGGLTGYLDDELGVYRVGVGVSSNIDKIHNSVIDSLGFALNYESDTVIICKILGREYFEYGLRRLSCGDERGFRFFVEKSFDGGYRSFNIFLAYLLRWKPDLYIKARKIIRDVRDVIAN